MCGSGRDGHRPQPLEVDSLLKLAAGNVLFPSTALPEQSAMEINSGQICCSQSRAAVQRVQKPLHTDGSVRSRTLISSTTANCPCQSSRESIIATTMSTRRFKSSIGSRSRMIPQVAGNDHRNANSPKSLSNVTRIRSRWIANSITCVSVIPGGISETLFTS